MLLINGEDDCESLIWTWYKEFFISSASGKTELAIIDTKLYVPVVTLSTEHNIKLLKQLKSGLNRIINWNNYQLKPTDQGQNKYLDYLIDPGFQGVNRLFLLLFENRTAQDIVFQK